MGDTGWVDDIEIRGFEELDRGSVVDLWQRCELTRAWNNPDLDIDRKIDHADDMFFVAVRGDRVVGSVMAGYDGHRGWINYLAVDPSERGEHLGSGLMEEAEQALRIHGCAKINLQIRRTNLGAQVFYERLGYVEDDVISMGKRLIEDTAD